MLYFEEGVEKEGVEKVKLVVKDYTPKSFDGGVNTKKENMSSSDVFIVEFINNALSFCNTETYRERRGLFLNYDYMIDAVFKSGLFADVHSNNAENIFRNTVFLGDFYRDTNELTIIRKLESGFIYFTVGCNGVFLQSFKLSDSADIRASSEKIMIPTKGKNPYSLAFHSYDHFELSKNMKLAEIVMFLVSPYDNSGRGGVCF